MSNVFKPSSADDISFLFSESKFDYATPKSHLNGHWNNSGFIKLHFSFFMWLIRKLYLIHFNVIINIYLFIYFTSYFNYFKW